MTPGHGLEVASNAPLRDGGATCWEGGIRVPGMVRWPGRIPAGRICTELLSSLDLLPLILSVSGASAPQNVVLDGRDPLAVLEGKGRSPHEALCFEYRRYQAIRSSNWKLLRAAADQPWQLFDLGRDIGETADVAKQYPEVASSLASQFETWRKSVGSA